jgi:hypothetical protein
MKYISIYNLLILFTLVPFLTKAQASPDATTELIKMQALFQNISYTSCDITYYYEEFDSAGTKLDTMSGVYKVDKDRFYFMLDSVEQIQNEFYHTTIDHMTKVVYVEKPYSAFTSVLQANILDSTFLEYNVQDMQVTDSSGFRKVSILFKAEAPYQYYEYVYDLSGLRPAYVRFALKKEHYIPEEPLGPEVEQLIKIHIVFSNFQTNAFTDAAFDMSGIFTRQNGSFTLNPKLALFYELINTYDQQ